MDTIFEFRQEILDFQSLRISTIETEQNYRLDSQESVLSRPEIVDLNEEVLNNVTKKVKKRHRRRKPKKKLQTESFSFQFKNVNSNPNAIRGRFYRKRDTIDVSCQHVNEFFYENGPHIFETVHHHRKEINNMNSKSSDVSTNVFRVIINETINCDHGKNELILIEGSSKCSSSSKSSKNENLQSIKEAAKSKKSKKNHKKMKTNVSEESPDDDEKKKKKTFLDYLSKDVVEEGLETGMFIKGPIRINSKNHHKAYVSHYDKKCRDYVLDSLIDRNRALEGDVVVIRVKPEEEWVDGQQTAEVVYIYEKVHSRTAIGTLHATWNRRQKMVILQPRDFRLPRILIQNKNLTFHLKDFFKNPAPFEQTLFKSEIIEWIKPQFAIGGKLEPIGDKNDLKSETKAILMEFDLDITPFPDDLQRKIGVEIQNVPEAEFDNREDLTSECVFTIDPETAKDLDDAVSLKTLENGNYEIGVHISDVSFYLHEENSLDKLVAKKATTIYLVDKVFHMLPEVMCKNLSLLPGKKSLTFSVFWEFSKDTSEILNHRFARTVINNCCQLSYEHAQKMIDDEPIENFPKIFNNFHQNDLKEIVVKLQEIAKVLRTKRFDSGALRIDQVKIGFRLDRETGSPIDFFRCENTESNRLIEEFMLLANITVATRILKDFPDLAFLRCHEPPNSRLIGEVKKMLETVGIHLDVSSSGGIQKSLQAYSTDTFLGSTRNAVLNHLLAKPMTRARYFCAALEENYEHYALSTPIYTHFTSPIRRYADVMVHRLLSASLGYRAKPNWSAEYVTEIAANCNKQKYNAKRAGEVHSDLFLVNYIERHQPFVVDAVVVEVREKFFDVLALCTGSIVRIYVKDINVPCDVEKIGTNTEKPFWRLKLDFGDTEKKLIEIFENVQVALKRNPKSNNLLGEMVVTKNK